MRNKHLFINLCFFCLLKFYIVSRTEKNLLKINISLLIQKQISVKNKHFNILCDSLRKTFILLMGTFWPRYIISSVGYAEITFTIGVRCNTQIIFIRYKFIYLFCKSKQRLQKLNRYTFQKKNKTFLLFKSRKDRHFNVFTDLLRKLFIRKLLKVFILMGSFWPSYTICVVVRRNKVYNLPVRCKTYKFVFIKCAK